MSDIQQIMIMRSSRTKGGRRELHRRWERNGAIDFVFFSISVWRCCHIYLASVIEPCRIRGVADAWTCVDLKKTMKHAEQIRCFGGTGRRRSEEKWSWDTLREARVLTRLWTTCLSLHAVFDSSLPSHPGSLLERKGLWKKLDEGKIDGCLGIELVVLGETWHG